MWRGEKTIFRSASLNARVEKSGCKVSIGARGAPKIPLSEEEGGGCKTSRSTLPTRKSLPPFPKVCPGLSQKSIVRREGEEASGMAPEIFRREGRREGETEVARSASSPESGEKKGITYTPCNFPLFGPSLSYTFPLLPFFRFGSPLPPPPSLPFSDCLMPPDFEFHTRARSNDEMLLLQRATLT